MGKIGESYQYINVFVVSIKNPSGGKSRNIHNHVLTLPH
jgi:hypothetical protein